jgi:hypothetical protein
MIVLVTKRFHRGGNAVSSKSRSSSSAGRLPRGGEILPRCVSHFENGLIASRANILICTRTRSNRNGETDSVLGIEVRFLRLPGRKSGTSLSYRSSNLTANTRRTVQLPYANRFASVFAQALD